MENKQLRPFQRRTPFGFVNEQGHYVGFDTDLGRRFARDLPGGEKKIEFVVVELAVTHDAFPVKAGPAGSPQFQWMHGVF